MTQKQLEELKNWTLLTNKLSQWHETNLRNFAYIAFNNIQNISIQYDLFGEENGTPYIRYILETKGKIGKSQSEIKKRIEDCTGWVKSIFWTDLKVEFTNKNGKPIVTTRKKRTNTRKSAKISG
jgi:hypothetical protein